MSICKISIITLVIFLLVSCSSSEEGFDRRGVVIEVHVGESIQEALDKAKSGDTVLVYPGIYKPEEAGEAFIVFRKRHNGVTLKGVALNSDKVVLDGDKKVLHVVFYDQGINRSTVMSGFEITGGFACPDKVLPVGYKTKLRAELGLDDDFYYDGAGVMIYNSSPVIRDNVITGNISERCGGGISVFLARRSNLFLNVLTYYFTHVQGPLIYNNMISSNKVNLTGAGIDVYYGTNALIANNIFMSNHSGKTGGAISVLSKASAEIYGNSIVENKASGEGSGVHVSRSAIDANIKNNIFAYNKGSDVITTKGNNILVDNSCFYNNDGGYVPPENNGNITENPLFVKGPKGKYYLSQILSGQDTQSPCINKGFNLKYSFFQNNLTTRTDGKPDDNSVDIGYHYTP